MIIECTCYCNADKPHNTVVQCPLCAAAPEMLKLLRPIARGFDFTEAEHKQWELDVSHLLAKTWSKFTDVTNYTAEYKPGGKG